ncbi:hypothetical protein J6590_037374 [Homalodisca vitripennis]|nr:hypothetical protein J6590_037374 [Homalodisca vitripennis]
MPSTHGMFTISWQSAGESCAKHLCKNSRRSKIVWNGRQEVRSTVSIHIHPVVTRSLGRRGSESLENREISVVYL